VRWTALGLAVAAVLIATARRRRRSRARGSQEPHVDAQLDEALEATFPASDPIAIGQIE
jgi:hypothetical protein